MAFYGLRLTWYKRWNAGNQLTWPTFSGEFLKGSSGWQVVLVKGSKVLRFLVKKMGNIEKQENTHLEVGYEPESTSEDVPLFNVAWRSDSGWCGVSDLLVDSAATRFLH